MKRLTVQQILFVHARLVAETGGSHGVRDLGLLESAAERPFGTFEGQDLYPDLFTKAAALMHSLVNNHPFIDGNKRTAFAAAVLFLELNGYKFLASNNEAAEFMLAAASGEVTLQQIIAWIKGNSEILKI